MMADELVDLSLRIRDGAPSYPTDPPCTVRPYQTIAADGVNVTALAMGTHQGTHLDAPYHFVEGGATVDRIRLEQVCGPAVLLDLSYKGPGDAIEIGDLEMAGLGEGGRLVYRVGWDHRLGQADYFLGGPRLTLEAARWLGGLRLALVGMDTPTPNPDAPIDVHRAVLGSGAVLLEGLANLDRLDPGPFELHAAPILIEGVDGAPVRAYARRAD
jgi:kynurenine formamidase